MLLHEELSFGEEPLDALYVVGELLQRDLGASLVSAVAEHLDSVDSAVVRTACWALGQLGIDERPDLQSRISEYALGHPSAEVRGEATTAVTRSLRALGARWAYDVAVRAADDADGSVRFCAVHGVRRWVEQGAKIDLNVGDPTDTDFGVRFEHSMLRLLKKSF